MKKFDLGLFVVFALYWGMEIGYCNEYSENLKGWDTDELIELFAVWAGELKPDENIDEFFAEKIKNL